MTRDDMKRVLNAELCTVVFTKKNGEERIMECTTRSDMIPANHLSSCLLYTSPSPRDS